MSTTAKSLVFPEFDDIKVSTKTFIAMTNLTIDLKKLFEFLPVTDYVVIPKKRGRKKKTTYTNPNIDIKAGSIVTMKYENKIKIPLNLSLTFLDMVPTCFTTTRAKMK